MIHSIFQWCVHVLLVAGQAIGIGYEAINVWVFVIIWPAVTLVMAAVIVWQQTQIRRLRRERLA